MTPPDKPGPEVAFNVVGNKIGDDREQLLHFPIDEDLAEVSQSRHGNIVLGTVEQFFRWCQLSSIWPVSFGLACCAIEMMSAAGTRYDLDRFGAGAMRGTPRQADLMIVSGTVTAKMANVYSPTVELAIPMGRKPAAVISVPVSMGMAVASHVKVAARMMS